MMLKSSLLTLATATLASAYRLERRANTSDVDTVRANVNQNTFATYPSPQTAQWLQTLKPDGSFSDVNYATGK